MTVDPGEFAKRFPAIAQHASRGQIKLLVSKLLPLKLATGEAVIQDGATSDTLYFVWDGALAATINQGGDTVMLGAIPAGEWVGEASILVPGAATATVTATEAADLLALTPGALAELEAADPVLSGRLVRAICLQLSERMRSSNTLLLERLGVSPESREIAESTRDLFTRIYKTLLGINDQE